MSELYRKLFTEKGIKSTPQRVAILSCLDAAHQPLTADEIYIEIKAKGIASCLSTVYRTMETLHDKKVVEKSTLLDDGKNRFELAHEEHKHHISCMKCHKIIAIDECPFEVIEETLEKKMNFHVIGHTFEIFGYCDACQQKE